MLSTAGVDRVLTMNLHAPQVHGFFSVPVDHLTALGVIADHYRDRDLSNTVVVSPDLGNAKQATLFARLLDLPVAAGSKQRLADDRVVIDAIVGDVAGKRAIVLDDEIATGGSIVELVDRLGDFGCDRGVGGVHPRPVRGPGGREAAERVADLRGGLHQHRAPARELPRADGAERGGTVRRRHRPHPRRPLGEQAVQRRGPVLCTATAAGRASFSPRR